MNATMMILCCPELHICLLFVFSFKVIFIFQAFRLSVNGYGEGNDNQICTAAVYLTLNLKNRSAHWQAYNIKLFWHDLQIYKFIIAQHPVAWYTNYRDTTLHLNRSYTSLQPAFFLSDSIIFLKHFPVLMKVCVCNSVINETCDEWWWLCCLFEMCKLEQVRERWNKKITLCWLKVIQPHLGEDSNHSTDKPRASFKCCVHLLFYSTFQWWENEGQDLDNF